MKLKVNDTIPETQIYILKDGHPKEQSIKEIFGKSINLDILFNKIKFIKDCRNPLTHAPPEPVPTEKEELLRFDCDLINSCVTKYLNNQ